jgi:hypothetical protein
MKEVFNVSFTDSCIINNGGCGTNAVCSHVQETNAVKCACQVGYVNVGSSSFTKCIGMIFRASQGRACVYRE